MDTKPSTTELNSWHEALRAQQEQKPAVCPTCGRCPTCSPARWVPLPYVAPYPYYPTTYAPYPWPYSQTIC